MSYLAIGSALNTLLDASTNLNVYNERAPQGSVTPYVIFNRQDARDSYTFGRKASIDADYVVKVVSSDYGPTGAQVAYESLHGSIQFGGTVTVNGYTLTHFERQATIQYQEPVATGGFWHVGGIYRIQVWEA